MKKLPLFLACIFLFPSFLPAQNAVEGHWGKKGFDAAYCAAATNDGGYIVGGLTQSGIDTTGDIIVIKTSAAGDTQWTLVYGGLLLEGANSVMQTADGGYLVSGHTEDFGSLDCDAFFMKLDQNGKRKWFKVYGGYQDDISESVIELPDGDLVMAGITESYGNHDSSDRRHVYFIKTNSTGDTIWTKYYAGKGAEYAYSIATVASGGFLAAGWSTSFGNGEHDGWLLRLKDNGDTLWTRLNRSVGDSRFYQIIPTIDNGYLLAGFTTPSSTCKPLGLAIKLDENGNELWRKTYGDTSTGTLFQGVVQLPNGNFIFSGTAYTPDSNIYVLTADGSGNEINDAVYGGNNSYGTCIAAQGNNSYLIGGASAKFGDALEDLYYMEMDNTNAHVSAIKIATPQLFPNPVKGKSVIILPASHANQSVNFEITSITGQTIMQQKLMAKDLIIDRAQLANGSYFFKVICTDGTQYTGKFTIE